MAQLVKNPPAMWEAWEIPQSREGYPLQYSGMENSMGYIYSPWGCREPGQMKYKLESSLA